MNAIDPQTQPAARCLPDAPKRHTFILGLPRSRTAWLAAFLTHGGCHCWHEALRMSDSWSSFKGLMTRPAASNVVADSDSALCLCPEQLLEDFPGARFVMVHRPLPEVMRSVSLWSRVNLRGLVRTNWPEIGRVFKRAVETLSGHAIHVQFNDLTDRSTMSELHEYATWGEPWILDRWTLFKDLNIQVSRSYDPFFISGAIQLLLLKSKENACQL